MYSKCPSNWTGVLLPYKGSNSTILNSDPLCLCVTIYDCIIVIYHLNPPQNLWRFNNFSLINAHWLFNYFKLSKMSTT